MKVTSYLISQKLAEIGFNKDHNYNYRFGCDTGWQIETGWASKERGDIPTYDLETILDALPEYVKTDKAYWFEMDKDGLYYYHHHLLLIESMKEKEKSLADTAARLLIKLHEAGLVKFANE